MSPPRTNFRATLFGKLPIALDFVRVNHDSAEAVAFDGWLQRALQFLAERGASWPARKLRFVYRDVARTEPLIGVVAPSKDRAGRRFPVALFAPAPAARRADDCALALAVGRFLSDVEHTLAELVGAALPEVAASVERLPCPTPTELQDCGAAADALLAGPAGALLELIPETATATPYARLRSAVRTLQELPPHRHLVWDLPAGCAEDRARWLAVHARTAPPDAGPVSWFWSEEDAERRLLLVTGAVPPALPFWTSSPTTRHDRLLSLRTDDARHASHPIEDELSSSATLRDLSQALAAVGT